MIAVVVIVCVALVLARVVWGWQQESPADKANKALAVEFLDMINAAPGTWFAAPDVIGASAVDGLNGKARFWLDPVMFDMYRNDAGVLFVRRRVRPEGLPV